MNRAALLTACLGAGLLLSPRAGAAAEGGAAPDYEVLSALPGAPEQGVRTELAVVLRDLRAYQRWAEHHRRTLQLTRAGAALLSPKGLTESFGFDPFAELQRLVELASPGGGPVPAALAITTGPAGPGLQLVVRVQEGFPQRLQQAAVAAERAPWSGAFEQGAVRIQVGGLELAGSLEEEGWLRLAPRPDMLIGSPAAPRPALEGAMRRWALESDGMLLLFGGGMLAGAVEAALESSGAGELVRGIRAVAVTWKYDGERSAFSRVLVDAPILEQLGSVIRDSRIDNSLSKMWGDDAVSFVSVSLPQSLLAALLPAAQRVLQDEQVILPDDVMYALTRLEGRVGYVSFGSPDDWAVGVRFLDAAVAQSFVPAVQSWLVQLAKELDTDAQRVYPLERFPGITGDVIHIRPDVGLEGMRVAAVGSTLVIVRQRHRLVELVGRAAAAPAAERPPASSSLLTPMMGQLVQRPSMLLGYMVLSDDGSIMEYAGWAVSSIQEVFRRERAKLPRLAFLDRYIERLPTLLAIEGFAWSLRYDVGFSADVDGGVLVLELVSSEI